MTIQSRFRATILRYDMIRPGERVVVAVSGGPDSMALLSLLSGVARTMRLDLHVAHLNHGWRGRASERDADFVRRFAIRQGLPVTVGVIDPAAWRRGSGRQSSREARARTLRTEFLLETARQIGAHRVALGHTRDDQAETFLLRLLRGSGARGLAGIYPVVDRQFIRPLIEIRRREILAYLKERRLTYRVDASNRDTTLTRNRIRRKLIPLLQREFNPAAVEAMAQAADLLRDEEAYLSDLARSAYETIATERDGSIVLTARALRDLPPALRRRVLRQAFATLRGGDLKRINMSHVEQPLRLLGEPRGRRSVHLPNGLMVTLERGELRVSRRRAALRAIRPDEAPDTVPAPAALPCREALCPVPGEVTLQGFDLRLKALIVPRGEIAPMLRPGNAGQAYLDADLLPGPLLIRPRRPGDRFIPLGGPGTRKVKSFLIDRKVPVGERGRIPLVLSGGRIAWVVGHQIDDRFKVTPQTRRILVLEKESG